MTKAEFEALRQLVFEMTGIKLADSKQQMLLSRLGKRLRANNLTTFRDYLNLLRSDLRGKGEMSEFINAVTTNKTGFFREPHHFDFIINQVIPEAKKSSLPASRNLSVWHAGCSTGEEAYTLAIALREGVPDINSWNVRQLATDIDSNVLDQARKGIYEIEKLEPVPLPLVRKYFLRGKGERSEQVRVKPELGEWLSLQRFSLLDKSWPIGESTRFDVIFCRNVMIYFDKPTQRELVARFRNCLRPNGYLIIGHSESLFGISDELELIGRTVYQRIDELEMAA
ncbi:MAG: Chemotaxis protein methyltransferase [Fimbriimonadaceae bacterium]|nr:Chemotaxis protein methyltransferase [Fimbriimonadaceae bacterium]